MKSILLAAVFLITAARVEAQSEPQRMWVSFAVGNAVGIGTDASDAVRTYAGSIRFDVRRHLAVETELAYMGDSADFVSGPGRFTTASNTVIGQYQSVSTHSGHSTWTGSLSVLAHSNGRVAVFGGGGAGFGVTQNDYRVSYTGCSSPTSPQTCSGYSLPRNNSGLTLHLTGGVEARLTEHISAFVSSQVQGAYRYGPTSLRGLGGVRLRVR